MTTIAYAHNKELLQRTSLQRYEYNRWTPDRPGWTGGKCPRSEYRGLIGESGAADFLGVPQESLCFYSSDRDDFTKADIYINGYGIEVKTGYKFRDKDFAKADIILFVTPVMNNKWTKCVYDTCGISLHQTYSGAVEVKGWITGDDERTDLGGYYSAAALRSPEALLTYVWDVAA